MNDLLVAAANPKSNYLAHKEEIDSAVLKALEGGAYILGDEVARFESAFAEYIGATATIGVGSGTDAIQLALRACGIGAGDVVITVSHTAVATVAAIELVSATPLLVDIEPAGFTIDPQQVEDAIRGFHSYDQGGKQIKAIIPVHLYGQPCDMKSLVEIARRFDLRIIEDCSQSHGAMIGEQRTGAFGDMATFSFYPTKNLAAIGDGGAVVTNNHVLADRARCLRQYGWRQHYVSDLVGGMNTRLDTLQAAILNVKLGHLEDENCRRRQIAARYHNDLAPADVVLPQARAGQRHVYHQYVIRTQKRDILRDYLFSKSIGTLIHYPAAVHQQPAYRSRVMIGDAGLPETEKVCQEILSLPVHPQLSEDQVRLVSEAILQWPG